MSSTHITDYYRTCKSNARITRSQAKLTSKVVNCDEISSKFAENSQIVPSSQLKTHNSQNERPLVKKKLTCDSIKKVDSESNVSKQNPSSKKDKSILPNLNENTFAKNERKHDSNQELKRALRDAVKAKHQITPALEKELPKTEKSVVDKFSYLANEKTELELPIHYIQIEEKFVLLDNVLQMLYNRKERATFSSVKSSLELMTHREFNQEHLSKIVSVAPDLFKVWLHCRTLCIAPTLEKSRFSASDIVDRKLYFRNKLRLLTFDYHDKFLKSLKMKVPPHDKLRRWHPAFKLDNLPDIKPILLPEPEKVEIITVSDVLAKARVDATNKMNAVLERIEKSKPTIDSHDKGCEFERNDKLKGISSSLLEKVRQRKKENEQRLLVQNDELEKKLSDLKALKEISRVLRFAFLSEKKAALPLEDVETRLSKFSSVKKHLELLSEICPKYITIQKVRNVEYVRMDRLLEYSIVLCDIDNAIKKCSLMV